MIAFIPAEQAFKPNGATASFRSLSPTCFRFRPPTRTYGQPDEPNPFPLHGPRPLLSCRKLLELHCRLARLAVPVLVGFHQLR